MAQEIPNDFSKDVQQIGEIKQMFRLPKAMTVIYWFRQIALTLIAAGSFIAGSLSLLGIADTGDNKERNTILMVAIPPFFLAGLWWFTANQSRNWLLVGEHGFAHWSRGKENVVLWSELESYKVVVPSSSLGPTLAPHILIKAPGRQFPIFEPQFGDLTGFRKALDQAVLDRDVPPLYAKIVRGEPVVLGSVTITADELSCHNKKLSLHEVKKFRIEDQTIWYDNGSDWQMWTRIGDPSVDPFTVASLVGMILESHQKGGRSR